MFYAIFLWFAQLTFVQRFQEPKTWRGAAIFPTTMTKLVLLTPAGKDSALLQATRVTKGERLFAATMETWAN